MCTSLKIVGRLQQLRMNLCCIYVSVSRDLVENMHVSGTPEPDFVNISYICMYIVAHGVYMYLFMYCYSNTSIFLC